MSTVATVSTLSGGATALRGGATIPLAEGMPLEQGDVLVTGDGAKLTVRFNDDAVIELGGSTRVQVKDFMFEPQEQSFSLHMLEGMVRSVSGKVVEQNPEAFTLTSPMGIVGIRGTETMHLISSKFEMHSVISLDDGHTVIVTTADGRSIVISESLKGVIIALGSQGALEQIDITPDVLDEYRMMMEDLGYLYNDPSGLFVLSDAAFMAGLGAYNLVGGLGFLSSERMGGLLNALAELDESLPGQTGFIPGADPYNPVASNPVPDNPGMYQVYDGNFMSFSGSAFNDTMILNSGGNNTLYGGKGDDRIVLAAGSSGTNMVHGGYGSWDHLVVERALDNDILYGDADILPQGERGDDDKIEVFGNMNGGSIYGDAEWGGNMTPDLGAGISYGGNDTIIIHGDVLSGIIYGDFRTGGQVDAAVCGDDSILIKGDVSGTTVYGDMVGYTDAPGSDTIHITGSVFGGASIYADTASMSPGMCTNLITVDGDVSGSYIHGSRDGSDTVIIKGTMDNGYIMTYGGNDSVSINNVEYGYVLLEEGNDTLSVTSFSGNLYASGGAGDDLYIFGNAVDDDVEARIDDFGINNRNGNGTDVIDLRNFSGNVNIDQDGEHTKILCSGNNGYEYIITLENVLSSDIVVGQNLIV